MWRVDHDGGVRSTGGDAARRKANPTAEPGGGVHEDEQLRECGDEERE